MAWLLHPLYLRRDHVKQLANDQHVFRREILLLELPNIHDVAVEHQNFRIDGPQVGQHFRGPAAAHAQMQI
jgi:hypothetical protein